MTPTNLVLLAIAVTLSIINVIVMLTINAAKDRIKAMKDDEFNG